ncbi:hypothetical protein EMIHUDRAFT_440747 [Emiliania huxleyi CCMP1516]|uniref:Uncharacterized protein n=2 Tax=Emiliania huxleyi TaxID=2903 RepID=A0A0D3KJW2_EMIH1|nr:hypothetical protein EMIHUDRAFT_440747 [Emiliania huxleyi CCMP1516]EOD36047.1 hypothetical protein EMIHUDRAFT_440747 [Emiliania huxleyi CCMP1516]|eukprot:XP_005788476.1 hypothetical protein EMIHUDRAFT_440747 [Emiliania huxleyi CCMP1516]
MAATTLGKLCSSSVAASGWEASAPRLPARRTSLSPTSAAMRSAPQVWAVPRRQRAPERPLSGVPARMASLDWDECLSADFEPARRPRLAGELLWGAACRPSGQL